LPGADNTAVLSEAGLSAQQIEALRAAGALGDVDAMQS
jgi:crotonobetainyl-CoA:carnitine CoA-transferase CaiB-like acyl-CoA transferase